MTPAPVVEQYLEVAPGQRLYVQHRPGDATRLPLFLLDGLGCAGFVWREVWRWFDGHPVVHMQYRGHGHSDVPHGVDTLTVDVAVSDVRRVLDALNLSAAVLVGHSMGVQVALECAHRLGHRVRGLGLLCGSYEKPIASWHGAQEKNGPARLDNLLLRAVFDPLSQFVIRRSSSLAPVWRAVFRTPLAYEIATRQEVDGTRLGIREFGPYMQDLAAMTPKVFFGFARSLAEHSAAPYLRQLDVPAWVLGGGRDSFTPRWRSEEMAHRLPRAELTVLPAGTHTTPLEYPATLYEGLSRLLQRASGKAGA